MVPNTIALIQPFLALLACVYLLEGTFSSRSAIGIKHTAATLGISCIAVK